MTSILQIQQFMLRALRACDGIPLDDNSLLSATLSLVPRPLVADYQAARGLLETNGYIAGEREMDGRTIIWTLTPKGAAKAKQL